MKRILYLALALSLQLCAKAPSDCVRYAVYLNYQGSVVPDFSTLGEPDITGTTDIFNFEGTEFERLDHCAGVLEYDLRIKADDVYTFRLSSDDGSILYIDGEKLIDNDGEHGPVRKEAAVSLTEGVHQVRVEYFEFHRSQSLFLHFKSTEGKFIPVGNYTEDDALLRKTADAQAKETAERLNRWKGTDGAVVFPILTDVHTCDRNTVSHIGYVAEMAGLFNYDFMVNLGDIGLNAERSHSFRSYADTVINATLSGMAKFKGVFLYSPGNHDYDGGEGRHITSGELSDIFQKPSLQYAGGNLHLTEGNCWSWYDIPAKKMRFITLNSQNSETIGDYYNYGTEQLQWLIDLLGTTPEDYAVLVFSHLMPHSIGRWPEQNYQNPSIPALISILSGYAQKTGGSECGLTWDFSGSNGCLAGLFTGDSHVNAHILENGVNFFISQGYGPVESGSMQECQKHEWFNSRQSLCCDIVVIKPETKEIRTFRLGAGGEQMDFQFSY